MSKLPIFPLLHDRYFADTKHLTCEEHGAYLQLLVFQWKADLAALDLSEDAYVARILSTTPRRWRRMKTKLLAFFDRGDDGLWRQKRVNEQRAKVEAIIEKRRQSGRLGGRPPKRERNPDLFDHAAETILDANPLERFDRPKANEKANGNQTESTQTQTQIPPTEVIPPPPLKGGSGLITDRDFDSWWGLLSNQVDKKLARAEWRVQVRRLAIAYDELMAGTRLFVSSSPIAHKINPRTILRRERWRDRPAAAPTNGKGGGLAAVYHALTSAQANGDAHAADPHAPAERTAVNGPGSGPGPGPADERPGPAWRGNGHSTRRPH